jgi:hypothetical protein
VQYAPPGDIAVVGATAPRVLPEGANAVTIIGNRIRIRQPADKPWRVSIVSPNGAVVKSFAGQEGRQAAVSIPRLATGVYMIKIVTNGNCAVRRMVVR